MKRLHFAASTSLNILLLCAISNVAVHAQGTAGIKLESLDKLSAKATEVVRKADPARGGGGMVYVRCFEFERAGDYSEADLREIRAQLQTEGWSRFMKVADKDDKRVDDETTEIYIFGKMAGGDTYSGMTIITTEPKELTVVNIVGQGNVKDFKRQTNKAEPPR